MTVTHMKWMADWLFVRGISRLVPHAFFYSLRLKEARDDRPPDAGPNNYFWSYYRDFSDYVARMGMLLYGRRSLARVAILTNGREMDDSISSALYVHQIPFHFVTVQALLEGECTEKGLRLPCQTVTCLLLPSSLKLPDTLLNRLEGMDRFRILSTREAGWIEQLTQDTQLQPMTFDQAPNFRVQWFEKEGTSYVLLTNEGEEPCHTAFTLPFRQTVKCLNPWTGETRNLGKLRSGKITLEAADSVVMQFTPGGTSKEPKADCGWQTIDLSDQVQFEDARLQALSALGNWQDKEGLSDYSGSLTYKLSLPAHLPSGPVVLSLGDVREMVVIQEPQSGREAHLLMGPWEVDISGLLNRQTSSADRPESTEASESSVIPDVAVQEGNGMTELLLTVTSSRVTEMDCKPWPCGLFGPVLLRIPSDQSI